LVIVTGNLLILLRIETKQERRLPLHDWLLSVGDDRANKALSTDAGSRLQDGEGSMKKVVAHQILFSF
jgi:hypothetical protein